VTADPGRHLPFEGAYNFREIGGIATPEGARLRRGLGYRSDHLNTLSRRDQARLGELGLRTIIDLRGEAEQRSRPSRLPNAQPPQVHRLPLATAEGDEAPLRRALLRGRLCATQYDQFMRQQYQGYIAQQQAQFRQIFALLSDANRYPLLIHCTAGKDRTGLVVALLQLALGVGREEIVADYLLSGPYLQGLIRRHTPMLRLLSLFRLRSEQLQLLVEPRAEYLELAFNRMAQEAGSSTGYLSAIGLDSAACNRLRALWLEPATAD